MISPPNNMGSLDLDTSLTICQSLSRVIKGAFGPHGMKSMITTATGRILVTTDGATILGCLNLSHPLAKFIVTSAIRNTHVTGSGGKTFIFYVTGALETIQNLALKHCRSHNNINVVQSFILQIANNLRCLLSKQLAPDLEKCFSLSGITESVKVKQWRDMANHLVHTELSPMFPTRLADHFTHVLMMLLIVDASTRSTGLIKNAKLVADSFQELCIKIDSQSYMESTCSKGVLVQREFTVQPSRQQCSPIKFILLKCSLHGVDEGKADSHRIQINTEEVLSDSLDQKQLKAENFVEFCRQHDINLVLTTEKLLNSAIHKCRLNGIAVVEFVPCSDIDRIGMLCNILPVHTPSELNPDQICKATSLKNVAFGGKSFVEINFEPFSNCVLARQLVVCAPNEGLCSQVCLSLHKAAKLLSYLQRDSSELGSSLPVMTETHLDCSVNDMSGRKDSDSPSSQINDDLEGNLDWDVIQGGGTFEMFVENYLDQLISQTADYTEAMACQVVRGAVSQIPCVLHGSMHRNCNSSVHKSYLQLHKESCERVGSGECVGLDSCTGELNRMPDIVEPLSCKIATLLKAIELVCQILRTDSIVCVKGVKRKPLKL